MRANESWRELLKSLQTLRRRVQEEADRQRVEREQRDPEIRWTPGALNLLDYLALRREDLRALQEALADAGLSSLGRAESHVRDALERVIGVLAAATGAPDAEHPVKAHALDRVCAHRELKVHSENLLGPAPEGRSTRIMVTIPGERADDEAFFRDLLQGGMQLARINCAHDGPDIWKQVVENLRRASAATGLPCRIVADLPGHKLRVGALPMVPGVQHLRPQRDRLGRVQEAAHLRVYWDASQEAGGAPHFLPQSPSALPEPGEVLLLRDARGKWRALTVEGVRGQELELSAQASVYLINGCPWHSRRRPHCRGEIRGIPDEPVDIRLRQGDRFWLHGDAVDPVPSLADGAVAAVPCSVPAILPKLQLGQQIWIDDGKMAAQVVRVGEQRVLLQVTRAKAGGTRLRPERGLNVPGLRLDFPPLSTEDRESLRVMAPLVDIIGLSFVESPESLRALRRALLEYGAEGLGVIAKIETAEAFRRLPDIVFSGIGHQPLGIMIARGDLAMELGPERLAEVQEEMLWLADAAHLPVIWATQVLESLAKKGIISRPELTDAAMAERSECVMLNKGPYILEAVHSLDDILRRMEGHQRKKFALMRALHWS